MKSASKGAGVHFKTINKAILPATGAYNLFFTLQTPKLPQVPWLPILKESRYHIVPPDITKNHQDLKELYDNIKLVYDEIQLLLRGFTPVMSKKRGLINAVGSLAKSLFGLSREEDIKDIYSHLSALKRDSSTNQNLSTKLQEGVLELRDRFHTLANYVNNTISSTNSINNDLLPLKELFDAFKSIQGSTNKQIWDQIFIHGLRLLIIQHASFI